MKYAIIKDKTVVAFVTDYDKFIDYVKTICSASSKSETSDWIEVHQLTLNLPLNIDDFKDFTMTQHLINEIQNNTIYLIEKYEATNVGYFSTSLEPQIKILLKWTLIKIDPAIESLILDTPSHTSRTNKLLTTCNKDDNKKDLCSNYAEYYIEDNVMKPYEITLYKFDYASVQKNSSIYIVGNNTNNKVQLAEQIKQHVIRNNNKSDGSGSKVFIFDSNPILWKDKVSNFSLITTNFKLNLLKLISNIKNEIVNPINYIIYIHIDQSNMQLLKDDFIYDMLFIKKICITILVTTDIVLDTKIRNNLDYIFIQNDPLTIEDRDLSLSNQELIEQQFYKLNYEHYGKPLKYLSDFKCVLVTTHGIVINNYIKDSDISKSWFRISE